MYRKILYIPQPCTKKIREREGGGEERGGERERGKEGGDRGETGGRQGERQGERGGERKRKLIFFFVQMNGKPRQKRLLPLFFFKE